VQQHDQGHRPDRSHQDMKTPNRVHHKNGRKRAVLQPETAHSPAAPVTLLIQDPAGRTFSRVRMRGELYAIIQTFCEQKGMTLPAFLNAAVRHALKRRNIPALRKACATKGGRS
jgi:hypothetical protein